MIEIFGFDESKKVCPPCINAKRLCKVRNKKHTFYPIHEASVKTDIMARLNQDSLSGLTMPQIFIDGQHVGGFSELKKLI